MLSCSLQPPTFHTHTHTHAVAHLSSSHVELPDVFGLHECECMLVCVGGCSANRSLQVPKANRQTSKQAISKQTDRRTDCLTNEPNQQANPPRTSSLLRRSTSAWHACETPTSPLPEFKLVQHDVRLKWIHCKFSVVETATSCNEKSSELKLVFALPSRKI